MGSRSTAASHARSGSGSAAAPKVMRSADNSAPHDGGAGAHAQDRVNEHFLRHPRRRMAGPLSGLRVVELQGRGPAPFGTMVLADLGADVLTISRVGDVAAAGAESGMKRMLRGHRTKDLV